MVREQLQLLLIQQCSIMNGTNIRTLVGEGVWNHSDGFLETFGFSLETSPFLPVDGLVALTDPKAMPPVL